MTSPQRKGSMLLLCIALSAVMAAMAFTFIRMARIQSETAVVQLGTRLANQAALDGAAHAMWAISRDYQNAASTPTNLYDGVHGAFAPPAGTTPDRQVRRGYQQAQQSPQAAGNDIELFDLLTQPAFTNRRSLPAGGGGGWDGPYAYDGTCSVRGLARWIESGKYARNGAAVDFQPYDSIGNDVARQVWYDSSWKPTTDANRMRYRVRYAVSVEDLSGHLLLPRQKPYTSPGATPWTATVSTPAGLPAPYNPAESLANEFDASWTLAGYHRSFYNMAELCGAQGQQFYAHSTGPGGTDNGLDTAFYRYSPPPPIPKDSNGNDLYTQANWDKMNNYWIDQLDRGGFYHWQLMFQGLGMGLDGNWFADFAQVSGAFDTRMPMFALRYMMKTDGTRLPNALGAQADLRARPAPGPGATPLLSSVPVANSDNIYDSLMNNAPPPLAHARAGAVYNWQQLKVDMLTEAVTPNNRFIGMTKKPDKSNGVYIGQSAGAWRGSDIGTHTSFAYTPFGSQVRNLRIAGGALPQHDGPWQVNLLTAPPAIIRSMVYGLLRSELKTSKYTTITRAPFDAAATAINKYNSYGASTVVASGTTTYTYNGVDYKLPYDISYDAVDLFTYAFAPTHIRASALAPDVPVFPENPVFNYNTVASGSAPSGLGSSKDYPYPGKDLALTGAEMPASSIPSHSFRWTQDVLGKDISTNTGLGDAILPERCQAISLKNSFETVRTLVEDNTCRLSYEGATNANDDTYWNDLTAATIHAIATARATWAAGAADSPVDALPSGMLRIDTIQQLDALFLGYLGYDPVALKVVTTDPNPNLNKTRRYWSGGANGEDRTSWQSISRSSTLSTLRTGNKLHASDTKLNAHRARLMERMTNDWRMSLFGATVSYDGTAATSYTAPGTLPSAPGPFAALDLDGDGKAYSSFTHAIDPTIDATTVAADPTTNWARLRTSGPLSGSGTIPFSLTGCFAIGKSHYWRIIVRGQAFDQLRGTPVDEVNYQAVYTVDPMGGGPGSSGMAQSHVIFQQILPNDQTGWRMAGTR